MKQERQKDESNLYTEGLYCNLPHRLFNTFINKLH